MLLLNVIVDGFRGKNSAVGTQDVVYKVFKQIFFTNPITVYQVIYDDCIIQIVQIPALCFNAVKFKTLRKTAPD